MGRIKLRLYYQETGLKATVRSSG